MPASKLRSPGSREATDGTPVPRNLLPIGLHTPKSQPDPGNPGAPLIHGGKPPHSPQGEVPCGGRRGSGLGSGLGLDLGSILGCRGLPLPPPPPGGYTGKYQVMPPQLTPGNPAPSVNSSQPPPPRSYWRLPLPRCGSHGQPWRDYTVISPSSDSASNAASSSAAPCGASFFWAASVLCKCAAGCVAPWICFRRRMEPRVQICVAVCRSRSAPSYRL
jgi:hypothetical protein